VTRAPTLGPRDANTLNDRFVELFARYALQIRAAMPLLHAIGLPDAVLMWTDVKPGLGFRGVPPVVPMHRNMVVPALAHAGTADDDERLAEVMSHPTPPGHLRFLLYADAGSVECAVGGALFAAEMPMEQVEAALAFVEEGEATE
jgi:hypothetical protein